MAHKPGGVQLKLLIGLFGDALIPRYPSREPLSHAVELNKDAVAGEVAPPVNVKLTKVGLGSRLFGTSTSTSKSPVWGPDDAVKPKRFGGFCDVGLFVPLSGQAVVKQTAIRGSCAGFLPPLSGSFVFRLAYAAPASIARNIAPQHIPQSDLKSDLRFNILTRSTAIGTRIGYAHSVP